MRVGLEVTQAARVGREHGVIPTEFGDSLMRESVSEKAADTGQRGIASSSSKVRYVDDVRAIHDDPPGSQYYYSEFDGEPHDRGGT